MLKRKKEKEQKGTVSLFIEQTDSKNAIIKEKILDILKDMNFKTISAKNENPSADFFIYARIETDETSKARYVCLVWLNPNTQEILYKKNISKRGAGFTEKEAHRSASVAIAKAIALVFNGIIDE